MTRIYVGARGHLVIAEESAPEAAITHFAGSAIEAIAVDPADPARVAVGLYSRQEVRGHVDPLTANGRSGVWRSDDAGDTWKNVSSGLPHSAVTSLAYAPDGTLYAGTEPSTLSRSPDGGETWQPAGDLTHLPSASTWAFPPRPYTHHVRYIALDPEDASRLYLCIEAGALIRSLDGGTTWIDRTANSPFDTHTLASHPGAPGRLYAAAGDGFLKPGDGYGESRDRGATWTRFGEGLQHHYLWGLAVDCKDPDVVLVSAAATPMAAHSPDGAESYVYRRSGSSSWELAMNGLPAPAGMSIPVITAHPTQGGQFYAATNQGIFRSDDAGQSWSIIPVPWQQHYRQQNAKAIALAT